MKSRTLALLVAGLYGLEPSLVTSIEAETETTIPSSIPSVDLPTVSDIPSISESETAAPTSSFAEEEETASSIPDDTETPSPSLTDLPTDIPTDTVTVATETETETATETDTESVTESEAETATEIATESATETVTESATETVTESATESETESSTESETESATEKTETATETAESSGPPSAAPTVPASFKLASTSGPTAGKSLQTRNANGFYLAFNTSYLPEASFSYEAETGYLRPGPAVYTCATYSVGQTFALLAACTPGTANWQMVTCEPPSGKTLQCSAPACDFVGHTVWGQAGTDMEGMSWTEYTQVCDPDAEPWTHLYTTTYELPEYEVWTIALGPENATGDDSLVPIDLAVQAVDSS
ncbi:unnamed protein product [Parascedosporium putredinis]|uniref:Uncharacterized protein n=1 Tax=Parascedosporium putredinis TaxID=1442378 RepID=A0A9P1H3G8_9PEZI|nr:unnamed protein product [Parascedosporium putredinis]CAI7997034.1 unnamed protein product [Parascedosporium putredinis]